MSLAEGAAFRAIAVAIVPEADAMSAHEWQQFASVINAALARRPAPMRRQLALFVRVLDLLAIIRYRKRLPRLSSGQRFALLRGIENSRLLLLRRGIWGLRTLVFMGYYARPEAAAALGYAAAPRGWELRR